ncbi:MAG TPA: excinuclease ABC subunit UvrA [Burkholderiaceae bacterium]|nr:excinuclease ABC subunit UvrA [Burkholderiaceae bacterium]
MDGSSSFDTATIRIRGARQNNLKNLDLDLPTNELIVVTGVSGSGKSSLVFDTLYAEGQRRYVETFSAYARQFLDRMDKPQVDRIEGVPPAIAIDQTNPVRTSRSTVGTMTELNDHLKLLFARAAHLHCRHCARPVQRDTPESIFDAMTARAEHLGDPRVLVSFAVQVPANFGEAEIRQFLEAQGYTRVLAQRETSNGQVLDVVQDRFRLGNADRARVVEAIEAALRMGQGRLAVHYLPNDGEDRPEIVSRFSTDLHCADCDIHYGDVQPSHFSFNSPLGACEACRGFGRTIGIDFNLVVPDERKSLRDGAIKPWQTESYREAQQDLLKSAAKYRVPVDVPWQQLSEEHKQWVLEGDPAFVNWDVSWPGIWYGVRRFFQWLEGRAYKMHIRVLLSKYRSYTVCETCGGSRLKPDALLWRVGGKSQADDALGAYQRFKPMQCDWSDAQLAALPGLTIFDLMNVPIERLARFVDTLELEGALDEATEMLMDELRARSRFLCEVGLGYLTLDRQSRTLSGGEVQRINLTTALGTSLVNTLFVLDEPSIGLHPRDMDRIIGVMHRLRDAGNTLVVVEHDPQVMLAADRIIDIGPGPGERGGQLVFQGTADEARRAPTLTGAYLAGRKRVAFDDERGHRAPDANTAWLELEGANLHNVRDVDVRVPLGHFVAITGVSGSGKSTLVQDVLHGALLKAFGKPSDAAGTYRALRGVEQIEDVVLVDQSPIGKTTRSNPASYVGAFDAIREVFARTPEAKTRGYTAGMFSFNSGDGRCATCGGTGFEHVEMQFLSDVYLRCPDCDGRRYRAETLEVLVASTDANGKFRHASIADVLDMTVSEAIAFFAEEPAVLAGLRPLADVGLEYLKLGQPVPTLSGGEAQRLKLAGHLAEAAFPGGASRGKRATKTEGLAVKGKLFLFDEPTTGLHFDDVATLLRAFSKLLKAGHTLVVIEHNLDVIRAADWAIDLGPEGGDAGGLIVAACTPNELKNVAASHTGRELAEYERALGFEGEAPAPAAALVAQEPMAAYGDAGPSLQSVLHARRRAAHDAIRIHHAREHNLKNIDVEIPREKFTVVTGPSGSGKSTLAFDIVFAEGQRRYLESLNAYARSIVQPQGRPDVDAIHGIPPTVAIEQRTSRGGRKSTVATLTEIYHFLRLLYVKLGTQHCPNCDVAVESQSFDLIAQRLMRDFRGQRVGLCAPLVVNRKGVYNDLAKWALARGHTHLRVDGVFVPTAKFPRLDRFSEHNIELPVADVRVTPDNENEVREGLRAALDTGKGFVKVVSNLDDLETAVRADESTGLHYPLEELMFSTKRACPSCGASFAELDPRLFSYNSKHGWCTGCYGTGLRLHGFKYDEAQERERASEGSWRDAAEAAADALDEEEGYTDEPCPACAGQRLNPTALAVRFRERSIAELSAMPVEELERELDRITLSGRELDIARDLLPEIRSRLAFLREVGLDYLALDRAAPTLSGGEAQRIRLAAQLGSNLQGVCYILDEPTIGLHPRDNRMLLDVLEKLRTKGNTLIVVEHDEDTIRRADHVIDIGPGAGVLGGEIVAQGTAEQLHGERSVTARFLHQPLIHPLQPRRLVADDAPRITIQGASLHNLQSVDVALPLARLTVVTGVSGSGKSTLARDVLHDNARAIVAKRDTAPTGCDAIDGLEAIDRVLEVDQTPIGKTPRSCPATYIGIWDEIRKLFADSQDARLRGYTASRFSFNTNGGRCAVCEGQGMRTIEMNFLPDVKVPCDACRGARFNRETLEVKMRGKSIGDVLAMNVDEAVEYFSAHVKLKHALKLLQDVGLGYLTLGQPSPTLSGGEAQRIKLVTELAKVRDDVTRRGQKPPHTLYVLDEPTVGLHMSDVEKLIRVLHKLVEAGNTVVVIEHDLDLIAEADWIVDLGPEGGHRGGALVGMGPPEQLMAHPGQSHTARILGEFLQGRLRR